MTPTKMIIKSHFSIDYDFNVILTLSSAIIPLGMILLSS